MRFRVQSGDLSSSRLDGVIVGLFEGSQGPTQAAAAVDKALGGAIADLVKRGEVKGKPNEIHVIHTLGKMPSRIVVVAGLGKKAELSIDRVRDALGESVRALRRHNCKTAATALHGAGAGGLSAEDAAQAIVEGCMLGAYQFKRHMTKKEDQGDVAEITILEKEVGRSGAIKAAVDRGQIIAEATMLARDMVNEPANHMTPTHLAGIAKDIADRYGLDIIVMEKMQMEREKMGALLGVAQGSDQPARFIVIEYKGDPSKKGSAGFVGKGLTFDSGGISLKPQDFMSEMKGDMAGAAAVIAAIGAIARLKLKVNITAIAPATENLPGGHALKPGDVLKASNGKTIEVVNTDAEGRLILSDALSYAVKNGISPLVDLATLTGACHVALGDMYAGLFTNDQKLGASVIAAGKAGGEPLWQLPLPDDYKELNKSDVADIKNSGGRYGGAITAALFLQEFVGKTPWVHLDIAAPFMADKTKGVLVKGATGFGVRTLVNLAIAMSRK